MDTQPPQSSPAGGLRHSRRLAWLLACLALGLLVGLAGAAPTGDARWYLAIPAAVALGWLFFADPTRCEPPARRGGPGKGGAL